MAWPCFVSSLTDKSVSLMSGVTTVSVFSNPAGVLIWSDPVCVILVLAPVAVCVWRLLVRFIDRPGWGV